MMAATIGEKHVNTASDLMEMGDAYISIKAQFGFSLCRPSRKPRFENGED